MGMHPTKVMLNVSVRTMHMIEIPEIGAISKSLKVYNARIPFNFRKSLSKARNDMSDTGFDNFTVKSL